MEENNIEITTKEEIIAQPNQGRFYNRFRFSKTIFFLLGIIVIVSIFGFIFFLGLSRNNNPQATKIQDNNGIKDILVQSKELKQWSNCDDVRDVIEEGNTLYVACLGGVLILDKKGNVIDDITMAQGLNNSTITSIEKEGNTLYVGSQKGFNIFDLQTRSMKSFTIDNGLSNDRNIELALDGDYLWVGTFEGLNRYNKKTGEMKSYTNVLVNNTSKANVNKILVTPKAVYVIVIAGDFNPGGVSRYDKETDKWENFNPQSFPINPAEASPNRSRIDLFSLALVGNSVLVGDSGKAVWQTEDKFGWSWTSVPEISQVAANDSSNYMYLTTGISDKAYVISKSNNVSEIYSYNPVNKQISKVNINNQSTFLQNVGSGMFGQFNRQDKIWFYSSTDSFLKWVDLRSLGTGEITLQKRPKSFNLVAAINGNAINMQKNFWQYDGKGFEKMANLANNDYFQDSAIPSVFQPIYNTSKIFMMIQSCGMGCSKPVMTVYDYKTKVIRKIDLSIIEGVANEFGYESFVFDKYDSKAGIITFTLVEQKKQLIIHTNDFSVSQKTIDLKDYSKVLQQGICNQNYVYKNDIFLEKTCMDKVENNEFEWQLKGDNKEKQLIQINKKTKQSEQVEVINPDVEPVIYFDGDKINMHFIRYANNALWIATNKGLLQYNPQDKSWKAITTSNGLVSNDIKNFIITDNTVWVDTSWGGLSSIPL